MLNVFVYGTLRADEINDIRRAAERSGVAAPRWLGKAVVRGRLYDFGAYPGLVPDAGAERVHGDVYAIDDALLPVLDHIEEVYPGRPGLFARDVLSVELGGKVRGCVFYPVDARSVAGRVQIACGDWVMHRREREQAA
jgi:gamma-glutamylcyclotransferase (GGCT)/AIG2-like uncharacterized protein YtfP